jgi:hemerythrin-like domain-containing protein
MRLTDTLEREHALVLRATRAGEQEVRYMRDTGECRPEALKALVDLFQCLTEACHEPKEEGLLFARLCRRGLSQEVGVLAQFYREHGELRSRLKAIADWLHAAKRGKSQDVASLAQQLDDYLKLMRSHIDREEDLLFGLANGLLTQQDQEELDDASKSMERVETDVGAEERYAQLAHLLIGRPTETLQADHQLCYPVLEAAERVIESAQAGGHLDSETIDRLIDFFYTFTRQCHEPKEAQLLFSRLAQRGMSTEDGLLAEMMQDHRDLGDRIESLVRHVSERQTDVPDAAAAVLSEMKAYVGLMRAHMTREDEVLFPMIDLVLTHRDLEDLGGAFTALESEEIVEGVHQKYVELAHRLAIT